MVWAVLGSLLLAVCAATGILFGLTWRIRFFWKDGDAGGRGAGGGLHGGGADPGVLGLLLAVPLLLGGALGASWRGEPATTAAGARILQ